MPPGQDLTAGRSTVLVVDDIPETMEHLTRLLGDLPRIEVIGCAATGREAIDAATSLLPDLILMDVVMPDLDGISAAETIHATLPAIRIVMMSIQNGAEYLARAERAGASAYLVKPFTASDLSQSLTTVLGHEVGDALPDRAAAIPGRIAVSGYVETKPEISVAQPQVAAYPAVALRRRLRTLGWFIAFLGGLAGILVALVAAAFLAIAIFGVAAKLAEPAGGLGYALSWLLGSGVALLVVVMAIGILREGITSTREKPAQRREALVVGSAVVVALLAFGLDGGHFLDLTLGGWFLVGTVWLLYRHFRGEGPSGSA